ncbi:MAG: class I SAM-dependent methyltransferase [Deltaproteobacteria bacterium]|nr:class I SAM-dependent methyltransferase [Deltaproteobacteria bacterium]
MKATFGSPLISVDGAYANFPVDHFSAQFQARFLTTRKPMDIHRMELPDESFDLVVSNTLLNRIFFGSGKATRRRVDDGFQTLKYMIRVTKVGGEIRTTDVPEPGANQRNVHRLDREVARYYLIRMGQLLEENAGRMVIVYPTYEGGYGRMTKIRKIRWP